MNPWDRRSLNVPPAALPGAKLLKSLTNRSLCYETDEFIIEGECDLTRGTRGEAHPQPAFEGGFCYSGFATLPPEALTIEGNLL